MECIHSLEVLKTIAKDHVVLVHMLTLHQFEGQSLTSLVIKFGTVKAMAADIVKSPV